jgi:hypothetical protein
MPDAFGHLVIPSFSHFSHSFLLLLGHWALTMLPHLSRETLRPGPPWLRPLPVALRLLLLLVGLGLATLLALAAHLRPDERGYGTHQQLGFPPCTMLTMFHLRCPSCGMTTAWAFAVRGRLPSAVAANSGGALLAVLALLAAPWSLVSALRGRWLGGAPAPHVVLMLMLSVVGVTLLDWTVRLIAR